MSTNALIGPTFENFKETAYKAVMDHFVRVAEMDKRPPTQRAMDSVKLQEAYRFQSGFPSTLLTREAAERGIAVDQLVPLIIFEGQKAFEIELSRVRLTLAVEQATTHEEILRLMKAEGVSLRLYEGLVDIAPAG